MKTMVCRMVLLVAILMSFPQTGWAADCGQLTLNAVDSGWYNAGGDHSPYNQNYLCGDAQGEAYPPTRNWFVFSIPAFTQEVSSAALRIPTFAVSSPDGFETYQLHHVNTPTSVLRGGGTGLTGIFVDLGDGPLYGSRSFFPEESYQTADVPLNEGFVSNLIAAAGSTLALGGVISSLDGVLANNEYLFGFSSGSGVQLILTLSGAAPLMILEQPASLAVDAGGTATFQVNACGVDPLSYQWQFIGEDIPGAIGPSLSLTNASWNEAGDYRVIVTNPAGSVTSVVATLTVTYRPPTASLYISSGHLPTTEGDTVIFCSSYSGSPAPVLQWQLNGTNLPGQTNVCLPLSNVQTNQSGDYRVVASNAAGLATSAVARLEVFPPQLVLAYYGWTYSPFYVGSCITFYSEVDGALAPFTLQWRRDGVDLPGNTNSYLSICPVYTNDAGLYTLVASSSFGSFTSPPLELATYYLAPATNSQPFFTVGGAAALVGQDIVLCASYGPSPGEVQWRFNGLELPGETNQCLALLGVTTNQAGGYSFTVVNPAGAATSSVATVTVSFQAPYFNSQPSSQTMVEGSKARFTATAPAGPPADYYLRFNGTTVGVPYAYEGCCGGFLGGFALLDVTFADAGDYFIIASNSVGMATSMVATLTVTPAGPFDRWTQRNPLPSSQPLFSVAHGPNQFVAVGDRGTIVTSPDGTNWARQSQRVDLPLNGVAYGGGLFVAVGSGGTILTSSDGTNWAYRMAAPGTTLNSVAFGNGQFVAVGRRQGVATLVLTSTDGIVWERIALTGADADQCVVFGGGRFVAAGNSAIVLSADGTNWITARNTTEKVESIAYANNLYVAVGDDGYVLVSSDGVGWSSRNLGTTRRLLGVTYGSGRWVIVGTRGVAYTSPDANTWVAATSGTPDRLETVDFANGLFVAAGENGTIITSSAGDTWTKQHRGTTRDLDGLDVGNGTLVVVGKGGSILSSTDGTHYSVQNAGVTNDLHGVGWGNGQWVAVGEPGIILTSSNAVQWTRRVSPSTNSFKRARYLNGKWLIVGTDSSVLASSNGVNWTAGSMPLVRDLNDVAFGKGSYVIASDGANNANGAAFISSDGLTWQNVSWFFGKNLRSILFTNGLFLAAANDGILFSSTNGLSWTQINVWNAFYFGNLRAATWMGGRWFLFGNGGGILTSSNLFNWELRPSRTFENLHDIGVIDGTLVTIGNRGTVLQSGRFVTELETPRYQPGVGVALPIKGIINRQYQLQASEDLLSWTNLITFTNTAERVTYTDTDAVLFPKRFYRVREP